MYGGKELPKQRGIYSEILTTEDTKHLQEVSTFGPPQSSFLEFNKKQKMPRALGLKKKTIEQIAEGRESKMSGADGTMLIGKNYFANPEVNAGFYSRKRAGVADVDPKVMEPFEPIPGRPPRKVVVDRQRKLFASLDIEDLLLELGIDYRNPAANPADWLPLEPFDDTEYDCRMPEEWLAFGETEDGGFQPIPAKGLCRNSDGSAVWRSVLINSYDSERQKFAGYWDDGGETGYVELTRINLLFNSEDPRIFAQRVAQAHSERIYADSQIRYNFFVDLMPQQELPELDSEQVSRILHCATASKYLRSRQVETSSILFEVQLDFGRTMNRIIMEKTIEKSEEELKQMIPANLTLPPKAPEKEVPYFGRVPVPPPNDFPEKFSNFCFHSLFIKDEVIRAMVDIREECNKVNQDYRIFETNMGGKIMRVEEFKQHQSASIASLRHSTREQGWVGRLEKIIKKEFNSVGKGWFNINENSKETYEFGKLKKFLLLVNFMMQDTVLTLCQDSVKEFKDFILEFVPEETIITDCANIKNIFKKKDTPPADESDDELADLEDDLPEAKMTKAEIRKQFAKNKDPEPLFELDLVLKPGALIPTYSTAPEEIVEKVKGIFEDGIKVLTQIPQLEPILLKHLFKALAEKTIKAPIIPVDEPKPPNKNKKSERLDDNAWLYYAFDEIMKNLERAIEPLAAYVETFAAFKEQNELNQDKYVADLDEGPEPITPEQLRADIDIQIKLEEELKDRMPTTVVVSMFKINNNDPRDKYAGKYQQIVQKEIQLIAQKAKDKNFFIQANFGEIKNKVNAEPTTIEELTETKKYIADCGLEIEKQKREIDKCMGFYKICDEFQYEFTGSEQTDKWTMYGLPMSVAKLIEAKNLELDKIKEAMTKKMEADQEEFDEALEGLVNTVQSFGDVYKNGDKYEENANTAEDVMAKIQEYIELSRQFNSREFAVGKEPTDYSAVQTMLRDFNPYYNLWKTTNNWHNLENKWKTGAWDELSPTEVEEEFENSLKVINQVFRFFRDREGLKDIFKIAETMKAKIDEFKPIVPLAVYLRKDGMAQRHWTEISEKVGFEVDPEKDEEFSLQTLIDMGMVKHNQVCEDVGERAGKEYHIEKSLKKMKEDWEPQVFRCPDFKKSGTQTISGFDEAINLLDEHIVTAQAMTFSPFKGPFKEEIDEWLKMMLTVSDTLEEWVKVQSNWTYLQPVFDSADIQKQLQAECKRFKGVDIKWRTVMQSTVAEPSILDNCSVEGRKENFQDCLKNLEIVQKGLKDYLERKCSFFCRFYFLSNDDLLEILSQTKEIRKVKAHLQKVFEGVSDLDFRPDNTMHGVISPQGEQIDFMKRVDPNDRGVEFWMSELERQMMLGVREAFWIGLDTYEKEPRTEWVKKQAGQIVLNSSQVFWTKDVEKAMNEGGLEALKVYYEFLKEQRKDTVKLVVGPLKKLAKISVNALIVIDVHALDVVGSLIESEIYEVTAFEWVMQLRYYWEPDEDEVDQVWVKCVVTRFPYGYEYLGNNGRLVITPLTDKCYMTLMGALQLNLGGAPAGPAGTGKTESTKDLAKALAKYCVVFNCSDGMDHLLVQRYFKGLAATGTFCCFDEFNRINEEVLSVIAQYLLQLFTAKARMEPEITFEGSHIKMKPTFCVFITMNPGYAGRKDLPDNLVALFRPVAMMVPDYAMIGEIMFYSFGFLEGRALAEKMVTTFTLASEQLSSQCHYDYGMRAVRTVINNAGILKNAFPNMDEQQLLQRALRDVNVPKFLIDDLPLFENIIIDLFPGVERPEQKYYGLVEEIEKACVKFNMDCSEDFLMKVLQLYDTTVVRHGLMIVGPTGAGKTQNYRVLSTAITALAHTEHYSKTIVDCLNPKSITKDQMYGFTDPSTMEWQDGILVRIVLDCTRDETTDRHWIMFDGPVDAVWIEDMNTVLDDNKKLCLNSGQIIQLTPYMTMMFEVEDLLVASPATVSRCGMVYMEPESLGLTPLVKSWMNDLPEKVRENKYLCEQIRKLFDDHLVDSCYFARKNCHEPVKTCDNNIAQSAMRIMSCFMTPYIETEIKKVPADQIDNLASQIREIFFFAFTWSIGCTTDLPGRDKFNKFLRERIQKASMPFPEEGLIYDYVWDVDTKEWTSWHNTIKEYVVDTKLAYNQIVVPTLDSIRMKWIMRTLIDGNKHVMIPGPTGTGKSTYVAELLQAELPEDFQALALSFSAQTSANQTQDYIDDKMVKRRTKVYGPEIGRRYCTFIDDLNMPKKEEYGAQPPIEIIRQFCDYQGWYDRKSKEKPFWKIEDMTLLAAMGPPGGGRSVISPRLQRHFNILTFTDLQDEAIRTIYKAVGSAFYSPFVEEVRDCLDPLIEAQLEIYDQMLNGPLKPTPSKQHYLFNLRDISRIYQGIVNADKKQITTPVALMRLWIHENTRVFGDRLIELKERKWLEEQLVQRAQSKFAISGKEIFNCERLIFGDFYEGIDVDTRVYKQVMDLDKMVEKIKEFLEEYNGDNKSQMHLVMFLDACDHVCRISRVIQRPLGNSFLLGVGGSGRQSLARLATYMSRYKVFQIEVVKGYGMSAWREDVKKVLLQAGGENKETSFLFVDTQIVNEQQLEDINNVLNGGDVPGLYKKEDFETIDKVGMQLCVENKIAVNKMNMFNQYVSRIKTNMHMIIAMSPLGGAFIERNRKFPSMINCSTIDWFSEWPEEALLGVGRGQILQAGVDLGDDLNGCVEMFKVIHQSVEHESKEFMDVLNRSNHVTPTSFLEQLNMYKDILGQKRKDVLAAKNRLVIGLDVMEKAQVEIVGLQKQIDEMTPDLIKTQKVIAEVLVVVNTKKAAADIERDIVSKEAAAAGVQEAEAEELRQEAQAQLDEAAPMLDEAAKVVKSLDKGELYTLASINRPTDIVVKMMELSCHMFGYKAKKANIGKVQNDPQGYFDLAKRSFLNAPAKFMDAMAEYDKENIPEATVKKVNVILNMPTMTVEAVKGASGALAGVYKWSAVMMKYHELLKIVNPRRIKVAEMKAELKIVREQLAAKMKQLADVEETLATLQAELDRNEEEGRRLDNKIGDCKLKLTRAGKIITGLAGEKARWTQTVADLGAEYELLVGNSLVAAGMVAYGGAFTSRFRHSMETTWVNTIKKLGIKVQEGCSMLGVLQDPVMTKTWTANQLPSDNLSIENALIMFKSRRWSLMIDPQNQAGKFIKSLAREKELCPNDLDVYKAKDTTLMRNLEISIQFGKWVLVENMGEEIDPALEPVLLKQVDKAGQLRLGDKSIPWNTDFKFFMTTNLPNPSYSPETQVKVTILNFAITPAGLEEQMLNQFVMQEMPDLQKKKDAIVAQNAQSAKTLRDIEEKILYNLTKNSEIKQILEEDTLIEVLDEAKITGDDIKVRLAEAAITEKEIDKSRESFRPIAFRAQTLFFTICELAVIDPMYQYSLQWFANLFGNSIEHSTKAPNDSAQRIINLNNAFTLNLYENICRSLFERHKMLFSFAMTIKILQGFDKIDPLELRFFLSGPSGDIKVPPNPTEWLTDLDWIETYKNLYCASQLDALNGFDKYFIANEGLFARIFDSLEPENEPLPGEWDEKLNSFQKMIFLKCLRLDKIPLAVQNYVSEHIGEKFISPPVFDIAGSFKESSLTTPLIFVLSKGADPNASFEGFAAKMNMTKKCKQVSLGRGQGPKAIMEINDKLQMGGWVLLMNCHLASSFMTTLEGIVENLDDTKHRDFRLWLTSMPDKGFPVSVLQNSVKMTLEPPSGLKLNCLGTYAGIENEDFEGCEKPEIFKKLLWGFVFFHAIVQDRRKFGPIGWNIQYAFMLEELTVSRRQLKIFVESYDFVPFKVLNYIGAEINYGGRVTDKNDKDLISCILRNYMKPEILEDGHNFSASGLYKTIPAGEKQDYIEYISSLPLNPKPEAFGLHENAEITTSQLQVIDLLSQMTMMQPKTSSGKGKTREEVIMETAKFLQSKTPPVFDLEMVGKQFVTDYLESMNTVIFQECVRYNGLLAVMHVSLKAVQRGLVGEIVMTEELDALATSMYTNQTPAAWSKVGFLSLKPLASWIVDTNDRINFLNTWITQGTPIKFWFSGFFFPQAFLTGTLQNYARKNKIPIDRIAYDYIIRDDIQHTDIKEAPAGGCYIYGLFLEGCKWDFEKHELADSDPKKLFVELPLIHLAPVVDRKKPEKGIYMCPMYRVLSRTGTLSTTGHSTNFVIMLEVPSNQSHDKWMLAGVACFLALRF